MEYFAAFKIDDHPNTLSVLEGRAGMRGHVKENIATFAFSSADARDRFVLNVWVLDHLRPIST